MQKREILTKETPVKHLLLFGLFPFLLGIICFFIAIGVSTLRSVEILELRLYDHRMRNELSLWGWKPFRWDNRHYRDENIAIVEIGDDFIRKNRVPELLWITEFTELVKGLHKAGAKVIGFDYGISRTPDDFIEYGIDTIIDRTEHVEKKEKERISRLLKGIYPPFDCEFGQAVRESNSVIGTWIESTDERYLLPNQKIFAFAGDENLGAVTIQPDIDAVVRSMPSDLEDKEKRTVRTFSFVMASRYLGKEEELNDATFLKEIVFFQGRDMLINYMGQARTFPYHPIDRVLEQIRRGDHKSLESEFKGKIILVGPTDLGSRDLKFTPFKNFQATFPGVEIHANAINTILHKDFIRKVPSTQNLVILFFLTVIYFIIGFRLTLGKSTALAVFLFAGYFLVAYYLFIQQRLWIDLAGPLIAIPLVLLVSYGYRFVVIEREERWIKRALERYVSAPVAEEILKHPDKMVDLGGEEREISVLFSDINDFTTISESKTPAQIMSALNEYFTFMEEIVFRNGGTLKQFVGDEIMVIFGAPHIQMDHRRRAIKTALEWREEIAKWRQKRESEGKFHFDMKIGIHCGKAVVGNVGSPHRTEYAAVGDTVNTASRIMGLNKKLDTLTLISEDVYRDVRDLVSVEDKGTHLVKGKGKELHIYSVTGRRR